jgi:hypothetical protein
LVVEMGLTGFERRGAGDAGCAAATRSYFLAPDERSIITEKCSNIGRDAQRFATGGNAMEGLAGQAFVAIWHDVAPEGRAAYYEWHNREHMPERVGIPGFRRGRRYLAERGGPEYFNLYEVDTLEVLTGKDYLDRLNNPTPWTTRTVGHIRNVARSLCRVDASLGRAQGGVMATWCLDVCAGQEARLRRYLIEEAVPAIFEAPGVLGAHFGTVDRSGSDLMTEERKMRGTATAIPGWIVLVEGISADAVATAGERVLTPGALVSHGAAPQVAHAVYRLETSRSRTPSAAG